VKSKNGRTSTPLPVRETEPWADIYAELRNKVRWAIGSTTAESGVISLPFRAQTAMAGVVAQDILEVLQRVYEKPDLRIEQENARDLLKR